MEKNCLEIWQDVFFLSVLCAISKNEYQSNIVLLRQLMLKIDGIFSALASSRLYLQIMASVYPFALSKLVLFII